MIHYMKGSIFDSECDWLVNPVNCVGVMGKGLAKQFKERYPAYFEDYKYECDFKSINTGFIYRWIGDEDGKNILTFPTKFHWREPSKIEYIETGLADFARWSSMIGPIAFPKLGCGLGGLHWADVQPVMERHLGAISEQVRVEVWESEK